MLEPIVDLPGIVGARASGEVSKDDYDKVVVPLLADAKREGRRLRFLFHIGREFQRFTPSGALEDARIGMQHAQIFERLAIVSDLEWVKAAATFTSTIAPCPVRTFGNDELEKATEWLSAPPQSSLDFRILPEERVLLIELGQHELRAEDFDVLSANVDDFESKNAPLQAIVVHARTRPHWQNLGSLLRHIRFVRSQQGKLDRVAIAVDGTLSHIVPAIVDRFVHPELKAFPYDGLDRAVKWASHARDAQAPTAQA